MRHTVEHLDRGGSLRVVRLEGYGQGSHDFVVLVWDGASNLGDIYNTFVKALDGVYEEVLGNYHGYYVGSGKYIDTVARECIASSASKFGKDKEKKDLSVLLVGKSKGGAKLYKLGDKHAADLRGFRSAAFVFVDAHEPGTPGDCGRAWKWYSWVRFRSHASVAWQNYDLEYTSAYKEYGEKLNLYATYQRNHWPRGYALSQGTKSLHQPGVDHESITRSGATIDLIRQAAQTLLWRPAQTMAV